MQKQQSLLWFVNYCRDVILKTKFIIKKNIKKVLNLSTTI